MDETVRQAFIKAAEVVDSAAEKAVESARKNVENVEQFVKVANEISAALLRAVGESRPEAASPGGTKTNLEHLFQYVYEHEKSGAFKKVLLARKNFLLRNASILEELYKTAKEASAKRPDTDWWSGKTDTF